MSVLQAQPQSPPRSNPSRALPPLESGDHLTRAEFERRYAAMPQVKKAELIEGIVYMPSPVRIHRHGVPQARLITWMGYYVARTCGLEDFADNTTLRLDEDNEPQPDLLLRLPPSAGGRSKVSEDGYLEASVELVAEVASSSVSLDMHKKLNVYRRHGVREYLVWRVDDSAVDWFAFREGRYEPLAVDPQGILRSEVFPGLWLDQAALLRGDLPALFKTIDAGANTAEHVAFEERLKV